MKEFELLDLIDFIYECGFEFKSWERVLKKIYELTEAKNVGFFFIDLKKDHYYVLDQYGTSNFFSSFCKDKLEINNLKAIIMKVYLEKSSIEAVDCTKEKLDCSYLYQNLLTSNDYGYVSALNISNNKEHFIGLGIHRSIDQDQLGFDQVEILIRLHPHFHRIFHFSDIFKKPYNKEDVLTSALVKIPFGLIVVDADFNIYFINDLASLLIKKFGIKIKDNQLIIERISSQRYLKLKIEDVLAGAQYSTSLQYENDDEAVPLSMTIVSSKTSGFNVYNEKSIISNVVLMYISHPELCSHISLGVLKEVYGLTTSEAQLALALTHGLSLQSYADSKKISIQTVRSQLKFVFHKVHVNSQTDLVRTLIMSSFNLI